MDSRAVVLSSGGIDSTTVMALAKHQGFRIYSLTVNYGQRHSQELDAARRVAAAMGVETHLVLDVDLRKIGGSALTDDIEVPPSDVESKEIPLTYVPARNIIFLSLALSWAEVLGCGDIFIGANAVDYSGYPDCRPEFITAFEGAANIGLKATATGMSTIRIQAPLIEMPKAQIIRTGARLGVDYALTHSCYNPEPGGAACGVCDSCVIRKRGFAAAGVPDPTHYM